MTWEPLDRNALDAMLAEALESADDEVRAAWERMRIAPQKWQCIPWGDQGGGFWAVALRPGEVVWYNDIEDGFNVSHYSTPGIIGEYWCNQSDFSAFLMTLRGASGTVDWSGADENGFFPDLATAPGAIVRRQTTYWQISVRGATWRVHFKSKEETRLAGTQFTKVVIEDDHPLLTDYHEAWKQVYVSTPFHDPAETQGALAVCVRLASGGWRELGDYINRQIDLTRGFGLLMRAPASIAQAVSSLLAGRRISTSVLDDRPARGRMKVLLMDRTFVVAETFRFEARK